MLDKRFGNAPAEDIAAVAERAMYEYYPVPNDKPFYSKRTSTSSSSMRAPPGARPEMIQACLCALRRA
jgi:hypothetical protein